MLAVHIEFTKKYNFRRRYEEVYFWKKFVKKGSVSFGESIDEANDLDRRFQDEFKPAIVRFF